MEYKRILEKYNESTNKRYGCLIIDANTHAYDMDNKNLLKFRDGEWDKVYEDMADV
jgi:NADH dehydrogenase/NADH:ubiquinone oxidoreductase subunit G